jgi:formylglycine-generating enzyme required for sulfatase activity
MHQRTTQILISFIGSIILFSFSLAVIQARNLQSEYITQRKTVYVPPGTFLMGSPPEELGREPDEIQHQVTLTKGFYIGVHEVTQREYKFVIGYNHSYFEHCGEDCPVEYVNWIEAVTYCNELSAMYGYKKAYTINGQDVSWNKTADGYRLPTEAEWECACRAGSTTAFYNGEISNIYQDNNCDSIAWYYYNAFYTSHPFGGKDSNAWGLYDFSGNVSEWCWDWYGEYPASPVSDPSGPATGSTRVLRGGDLYDNAKSCRSADRKSMNPVYRANSAGFRIARNAY